MTDQTSIDIMKDFADALVATSLIVKEAHVDDWDDFNSFQILIWPHHRDRHTTNKIKAAVNHLLSNRHEQFDKIIPRWYDSPGKRDVDYWKFVFDVAGALDGKSPTW